VVTTIQYRQLPDELKALSDGDLAGTLSFLTVSNIKNDVVRDWLRKEGLWYHASPVTMGGTIQTALDADPLLIPQSIVDLLGQFYAAIFGGASETLSTHEKDVASQFDQGLSGLVAVGLLTNDQVSAFRAFGGGLKYGVVIESEVTTVKAGVATEDAAQANADTVQADVATQMNETINPAIATSDIVTIVAALRTAATALEV